MSKFLFGAGIDWASLINPKDIERAKAASGNFDSLMEAGGEDPAFDYLIKHVSGGSSFFRQVWSSRGLSSEESARLVNKYGTGANRGFVDANNNEYVFGGNPFTKEGGVRYKLPNTHVR